MLKVEYSYWGGRDCEEGHAWLGVLWLVVRDGVVKSVDATGLLERNGLIT